jgi:tartrate-resistant acid phosphatase type 5
MLWPRIFSTALLTLALGCDCGSSLAPVDEGDAGGEATAPDAGAGAGAGTVADAGGSPDAGASGDAGAVVDAGAIIDAGLNPPDAGEPDAGPPPPFVRFVAIGDVGKGNEGQHLVAAAMKAVCDERGGCDFGVMLGDNIYDTGVADVDDAQWQEKFELPYADIDFAFYATLGNHDYGAPSQLSSLGGLGISPSRGAAQVQYTDVSEKFIMPDTHYRVLEDPVELVSLNTTSLFWGDLSLVASLTGFDDENDRLVQSVTGWNAEPPGPWRIAFGHHPYLSNGRHGNAGSYDGVIIDGLIGSGTTIKAFIEDYVLGRFDVFLCGHDHNLQDLGEVEGTQLLVSGGGATSRTLQGSNQALWQASRRGFLLVEATPTEMTFTFVVVPNDEDEEDEPHYVAHTRTITR